MFMKKIILLLSLGLFSHSSSAAGVCDAINPFNASTGSVAAVGVGARVAGFYAITNATTGAAMLGSTTSGIIAGTSGVIGTIGGALLSPYVIGVTTVATIVVGGVCYFI